MGDRYEEYINRFKEILKEDPKNEYALRILARISIKENEFDEAENYYTIILENDSKDLESIYMKGFLSMRKKDYKKSLEYFNGFININEENAFVYEYMALMDSENRDKYFKKAIEINDNTRISRKDYDRYAYMAFKTYEWEEYDISLNYSNYAYSAKQTNNMLNLLGCVYYKKGDYDKALSFFHDLNFTYDKKNIYVLFNISSCYRGKNSVNLAIRYLEKAREIDENNKLIYYNIGSIYSNLGDKKSALENFETALSLDADYKEALKAKEDINRQN